MMSEVCASWDQVLAEVARAELQTIMSLVTTGIIMEHTISMSDCWQR